MASESDVSSEAYTRFETELALLQEMYPQQITFTSKSRELKYTSPHSPNAVLILAKTDIRDKVQYVYYSTIFAEGYGESLDSCIEYYEQITAESTGGNLAAIIGGKSEPSKNKSAGKTTEGALRSKTVIIWVHHIFAAWKRKFCSTPTYNSTIVADHVDICGIMKPGCPGVMVFSGRRDVVDAHVREVKGLKWQACQVRYDTSEEDTEGGQEEWEFSCAKGKIVEVETMAELVQNIVKEENKQTFLKVVKVK
ncbi:hypothetical protein H2200_008946 [Cladophialophora chaetospira]|uniref:RWD domain-containing protein n=1 Tax=Cladophialophora chaetospira TaxID=386627 RepID=A0AA38X5F4_9EURO|nr:hypothetical protein H2200_008946 [Cladophialophora chaetospira]